MSYHPLSLVKVGNNPKMDLCPVLRGSSINGRAYKLDAKRRSLKEKRESKLPLPLLSRKDSNLDKQNQNLLCYHYTTRQALPFHDKLTRSA